MRNYSDFLAVRALLGIFEGGMIPYDNILFVISTLLSHEAHSGISFLLSRVRRSDRWSVLYLYR
jgi:hypothetical protein